MTNFARGHFMMTGIGFAAMTIGGAMLWGWGGAILAGGFGMLLVCISEPAQ